MPSIAAKIKPAGGFSHVVHIILTVLLPALVFIFIRLHFTGLAVALVLLSKWRMFAIKPRHWLANIRANAVDLTVGLSLLIFMSQSGSQLIQLAWAIAYGVWLVTIKPLSSLLGTSVQALIAQVLGLTALFLQWGGAPIYTLVILGWMICYSAARHFFTSFDESLSSYLSHTWGYFAAAMIWVLSHWLLFYGSVAQPTLLLSVIGFSLAGIYYLEETDRLSILLRRQLVFVMVAIIVIVLTFSDWGDKAI